ncbi:MAG: hypothetical protein Kapaf2KO_17450 [Candidatus Kapaibacteriales bacterium]
MKKSLLLFLTFLTLLSLYSLDIQGKKISSEDVKIKNGDLIFQTTQSAQCEAVQLATDSKYSHMGIIFEEEGKYFVYEAVQPVKLTPLNNWIGRGKNNHYVIKDSIIQKKY